MTLKIIIYFIIFHMGLYVSSFAKNGNVILCQCLSIFQVQNFLLHFWQGMPAHMTAILGASQIVGMVAVCDTILYKAICNVLMPHVLQALPER